MPSTTKYLIVFKDFHQLNRSEKAVHEAIAENAPDVACKREGAQLHRGIGDKEKSGEDRSLNKK